MSDQPSTQPSPYISPRASDQASDQALDARIVDLDLIAENLRTALLAQPGLLRLEPTVRSTIQRLKLASVAVVQQTFAKNLDDPSVSVTDGLTLTLAGTVVNAHIDIATDIAHPALALSEKLQELTADTIERSGLLVGTIDITILSIEGTPPPTPHQSADQRNPVGTARPAALHDDWQGSAGYGV
ncbi:hypothetical protein [Arthrobacter sp. CP30]